MIDDVPNIRVTELDSKEKCESALHYYNTMRKANCTPIIRHGGMMLSNSYECEDAIDAMNKIANRCSKLYPKFK